MIDKSLLERLYLSYGFEQAQTGDSNVSIFLYKKSRYFGVDIIPLDLNVDTVKSAETIKDEYSKSGYAVNLKKICSNEEAEVELFKSFFNFESTRQRLNRKYNDFKNKQKLSLLGNEYEYLETPFEIHNHNYDDKHLFSIIEKRLTSEKAELIIIEAAAGYGKTCTAFEALVKIVENAGNQLPIFTELARNRGANIFRYILLDEIDLEFPSLNSDLVVKEIKNGRIPLIIDGFDELLDKVDADATLDNSFEDVESMLDTIGSLLEFKTKIILTTRKTAIFTGVEFESWLLKWTANFGITRIALREPRIKDWLGQEKYTLIKEKGVPIQNLANPVLLTFLKNLGIEEFKELIESPDKLIQKYFEKMLEREQLRQQLFMSVENQLSLFRNVARNLLELDSSVEDKEFFKLIIIEDNKKLLEETRNLYSGTIKRTVENLVDTLSTHALLDRKGRDQNQIGFINDFVFGYFLGQILIELSEELNSKKYSSYMIELAVTAFRIQNLSTKTLLWEKVQSILDRFQAETVFLFDVYLKEELMRNYSDISICDTSFFNITFIAHTITAAVFVNCLFKSCDFDGDIFIGVSFINCTFSDCKVINSEYFDQDNGIIAIKCTQIKCNILYHRDTPIYDSLTPSIVSDFEKMVLFKIWSISNTKGHHITKLIHSFEKPIRKKVQLALKSLEHKGLLDIRGIHLYFEINKINIIKEILEIA